MSKKMTSGEREKERERDYPRFFVSKTHAKKESVGGV
jgi:hypothetical protein